MGDIHRASKMTYTFHQDVRRIYALMLSVMEDGQRMQETYLGDRCGSGKFGPGRRGEGEVRRRTREMSTASASDRG